VEGSGTEFAVTPNEIVDSAGNELNGGKGKLTLMSWRSKERSDAPNPEMLVESSDNPVILAV
jgi:hypothetical protein